MKTHDNNLLGQFESDVNVVNALIIMYVQCGNINTARLVFDKMPNQDRTLWSALISSYFEYKEPFLLRYALYLLPEDLFFFLFEIGRGS